MLRPPFPTSEYESRVRQLQAGMAERGVAGAVLTSEANYNYFTAYHHFAPWTTHCRSVFAIVPTAGEPVLLLHAFPAADARIDCWFDDVRGYDSLTYAPIDQVVSIVHELGMDAGPIGMELGSEHRIGLTAIELDDLGARSRRPASSTSAICSGACGSSSRRPRSACWRSRAGSPPRRSPSASRTPGSG